MISLKRFTGDSFYILNQYENDEIIFKLTVTEIDKNGDYVTLLVNKGGRKWAFTLHSSDGLNRTTKYTVRDIVDIHFKGIFLYMNKKLSVTIGFDTAFKVLRHELLTNSVRITPSKNGVH